MNQAELIRTSFAVVADRADDLLATFYDRLFQQHPSVRSLFPDDMTAQRSHLAAAVGLVVKHADNLDALSGALQEMGARHQGYGAQPAHYPIVRDVLVATIGDVAGDAWTPDFQRAWIGALDQIAATMLDGASAPSA